MRNLSTAEIGNVAGAGLGLGVLGGLNLNLKPVAVSVGAAVGAATGSSNGASVGVGVGVGVGLGLGGLLGGGNSCKKYC